MMQDILTALDALTAALARLPDGYARRQAAWKARECALWARCAADPIEPNEPNKNQSETEE